VPGLDGIRALAVLSVIAYHLNFSWAQGGMLGVGVFFTLSGYLITDLLLGHWHRHGDLGLGQFWLRRARRLLPALFLMLVVVSVWVALLHAGELAAVRRQVVAAALYFSNWSTIALHGSYFSRFAAPLPLDHLWSLAIEEQFYLLWPWMLLLAIWIVRSRWGIALLVLLGAAASAIVMGHLYQPGYDPTRVYEGTDTRAFGLLIGAALAILWPGRVVARGVRGSRRDLLDTLGVVGLIGILLLVWRTGSFSSFLYPGGFVLLSLATAAVVAAVVVPTSRLGAVLGCRPLRWIGVRSYGIYLWHWPIIVLTGQSQTGVALGRSALQVAATLVVASLSWRFVEEPIRQGALGRIWRQLQSGAGRIRVQTRAIWLAGGAAAAAIAAVVSLSGALPAASAGSSASNTAGPLITLPRHVVRVAARGTKRHRREPVSTRTSCRSVVYIGDSTSEGETSTDYIPDPRKRLQAQLADVGVTTTYPEISGARSIVETFEGYPNAATVAQRHIAAGFHGCWILALGTNDVDNIHDGGPPAAYRIHRMLSIIGNQPVMWVNVVTVLRDGPYQEAAMQRWNAAVLAACPRHPLMRVFDWAAHVQQRWFIPDGIHYYSPGYVARTHLIARALAQAFPAHGPPSASCVVE